MPVAERRRVRLTQVAMIALTAAAVALLLLAAAAFLRLGREACPQLRWHCESVVKALDEALACYFRELEE